MNYLDLVPTSQSTQCISVSMTETNSLMLLREIIVLIVSNIQKTQSKEMVCAKCRYYYNKNSIAHIIVTVCLKDQ